MLCMFTLIPFSENTLAGINHKQSPFPCCFIRWWVQVQYYQRFQQAAVMAVIMEATVMSYHNRLVHLLLFVGLCESWTLDWTGLKAAVYRWQTSPKLRWPVSVSAQSSSLAYWGLRVSFLNFWEISLAYRTCWNTLTETKLQSSLKHVYNVWKAWSVLYTNVHGFYEMDAQTLFLQPKGFSNSHLCWQKPNSNLCW